MQPGRTDAVGLDLMTVKLIAACRAFRGWALGHQPECSMIFGSPLPGLELAQDDPVMGCGLRFCQVFLDLFHEPGCAARSMSPAPVMRIDPRCGVSWMRHQRADAGSDLPIGALQTFLRCWVVLYGAVYLEVFGHLRFALDDPSPMFELMLCDLTPMLGLTYPLPR